MKYLILFSDENRPENIGLPLWKPLVGGDDYDFAAARYRNYVARKEHRRLLWIQFNPSGLFRIMGFVDWTEQGDYTLHLNMPAEVFEAEEEATRHWFQDKGVF